MDYERELIALSKVLFILTQELKENNSPSISDAYGYVSREIITPILASEAAFEDFYSRTGKDIRSVDWRPSRSFIARNGEKFSIHKLYTGDHIQTCSDFRNELFKAYEENRLTEKLIADILRQRYVCWITKEEDSRLNALGYKSTRSNPYGAYAEAGIKIYTGSLSALPKTELKTEKRRAISMLPSETPRVSQGKCKIGECFIFTDEIVTMKNKESAYAVYNQQGERVGFVYETRDKRTAAYESAEIGFLKRYKGKLFCRFTSNGVRLNWASLRDRIISEKEIKLYID